MTDKEEKLFRLLGSDNDHEALAALRALQKSVGNWNLFVDGLKPKLKKAPPFRNEPVSEEEIARNMANYHRDFEERLRTIKNYTERSK